ncbi:MAG TPA: DUF4139 domain-containing protein [Polyangiaceae bacterium]|nr:DUF4139 domain-containing protein [Polyangiaceae bacterium]
MRVRTQTCWVWRPNSRFAGVTAAGLLLGCGTAGLPVRHAAIYRNGVAYLERSGHVGAREVRFRMRESEIGDFLATLAVTERGGSSVRTAAFPIAPASGDEDKNETRTVVLSLDGATHDLDVSYIAQAPVWKPSYRLIMGEGDIAEFQVWGLVQNLSGEDWRDVRLSLVAGAPIAFSSQMQTPVIPNRPVVVDRGESIGAVPASETTLMQAQRNQGPQDASIRVAGQAPPSTPRSRPAMTYEYHFKTADKAVRPDEAQPAMTDAVAPEFFGGSTRYDLALPVTIPNDSTSMVMMLSSRVKGEEIFLFAPDGGIPASAVHPFRAMRFANDTGGEIEAGPIALFGRGVFLGQALLEPVPVGASATLPFALDRAIAVEVASKAGGPGPDGERIVKIAEGKLSIAVAHGVRTVYRVSNGGEKAAKVLVKHGLTGGAKLVAPPPGAEERVGAATALVPSDVPSHETKEIVVDERSENVQVADWFGDPAGFAVRAFLASPQSDRGVVAALDADIARASEAFKSLVEDVRVNP